MTELQERIAEALKANPERSNRSIGDELGTDKNTVAKVRSRLEADGTIPRVETVVDTLGRAQAARTETPVESPRPVVSPRTSEEWRATIATLESELDALDAEIAKLNSTREQAAFAAAADDEEAKKVLQQSGARLATREQKRADTLLVLEAARRHLKEAEEREEAERREAKRREVEALSQERLKAARAVDEALESLAEALRSYRGVCERQQVTALEAGLHAPYYRHPAHAVNRAAGTVLHGLLPGIVYERHPGTLAELDHVAREAAQAEEKKVGDAA